MMMTKTIILFPASAGVILDEQIAILKVLTVPRIRGGDPLL